MNNTWDYIPPEDDYVDPDPEGTKAFAEAVRALSDGGSGGGSSSCACCMG